MEMVIALPLFFTVLVIVADLGRVVGIQSGLRTASYLGTQVGALSPAQGTTAENWQQSVEATVHEQLNRYYWYSESNLIDVVVFTTNNHGVESVRVEITYDFNPLYSLGGLIGPVAVNGNATLPLVK